MICGMTSTQMPASDLSLVEFLRAEHQKRRDPPLPSRARRREIREAAGASQRAVARECGVSGFTVNQWEKADGRTEPTGQNRIKYKQVLDELEALAAEFAQDSAQK